MATKIVTKNSSTASAVPTASDLVQGELAVNVADKRLFTEDNGGSIVELGTNPSGNVTFQDNGKAIFGAGSDLQIYHDGSNSYIDEAGQGTLYVRADSATSIANPSNTLSARFRPSTSVSLYYNGAEKLATTSTGIDVTGNLTMASGGSIVAGGVNDLILNAGESGTPDIYLQSGSSTKVKIEGSNGNVGIGTGSPSEKLHVQGDGADILLTDSAGGQTAKLGATGSNNGLLELNNSAHVGTVFLNSSGDSYLNGGNVGIGTSSPSSYFSPQLVVHSSSNLGGITIRSNATTDTNYLLFADGTSGNERYRGYVSYDHNADTMKLATGASPAITIDSSGYVGIGAISPASGLELEGVGNATNVTLDNTTGSTGRSYSIRSGNTGNLDFYDNDATTARLVIDSAGRLGLGVTPEAWSSVFKVLRVGTGSSIAGESGGTSTWFNTNAYYDGSWKRINTNTSAQIAHTSDGKQEFRVSASGSAGGAISWNTAVTINNSGALLVGGSVEGPGAQSGIALSGQETDSNIYIRHASGTGSGSRYMAFTYNTSQLGSITQHGTSQILFNTTSDERAKEKIVDAPSASDDIDAIQVRSFDWKADGEHQKYGMIAQELQTVAPEAVHQPEDSEEMMGVDYSKLVPIMLKEIQSLRARIAALES